jgi:hypothetical protein
VWRTKPHSTAGKVSKLLLTILNYSAVIHLKYQSPSRYCSQHKETVVIIFLNTQFQFSFRLLSSISLYQVVWEIKDYASIKLLD